MNLNVFQRRVRKLTGGEKKGKFQARKELCVKAASVVSQEAESQSDPMCGRLFQSLGQTEGGLTVNYFALLTSVFSSVIEGWSQ